MPAPRETAASPASVPTPASPDFAEYYVRMVNRYHTGTLSPRALAAWHAERLTTVLRHVTTRSPFYRRRLAGVAVDTVTPGTLHRLPFTTKADLRREMHAVLSGTPAEARIFYETTGTTGAPTPCPRGARDILTSNAAVERSLRHLCAQRFGDRLPVVGLMGPSELYAFGDVFTDVTARLGACHVKIWPESPRVGFRKALRLISELGVEVVIGAPALCLSLAKAVRYHGYRTDQLKISMFLVLGEICTPEFGDNVASVWPGAVVYPMLYGSQEALCIATGAATGKLHLCELNYLAELVDPDTGAHRGCTGEGELVVTMLIDGIKPLIRYRTGDLVRIDPRPDGSGLPGPVIEVIGRTADRVQLGSALLLPAQLESAVLHGVRGCLGYQVVIDRDRDGNDTVTVRLDLLPEISGNPTAIRAGITRRLRDHAGVPVDVEVEADLDPVTHTGSFVSWKAARILDRRSDGDPAARVARQVAPRYAITT